MVNKNLFNAAVLGLGLAFGYNPAYAQEGQGDLVAESVADPAVAVESCPTCPPNVQVNVQNVVPPADNPVKKKSKGKKGFVPKGDCTAQFNGNGRCISKAEANMGGYTSLVRGYCPGKDLCYDHTPKPVAEEKKAEVPAEDDFFRIVYQGQCDDEKAELRRLNAARTAEEAQCKEAEKSLVDYVASVAPSEDGKTVLTTPTLEQLLKGDFKTESSRVDPQKVGDYKAAIQKECGEVQVAVKALTDYATFVKEKGCNYQEPAQVTISGPAKEQVKEPVKVDNFDVTPYIGALVDTEGNSGGVAGVEVLYRLGWVKLGGYADATLQNQSKSESRTNDLGIATEDVKTESDLRRYAGGGAAASLPLGTELAELQFRLGGAWMRSSAEKTITRLDKVGELSSSAHSLAGEGYAGLRVNPYDQWIIDAGARSNTLSEEATFQFSVGHRF